MGYLERWLHILPLRLRSLFRRHQAEQDLRDELLFHMEQQAQRHVDRGVSQAVAEQAVRQEMYGIERVKDACRDARGTQWIEDAISDARYAIRTLRQSPGFTAVAVLTLAVGIGVNAAVFTVTNAILFKGFPHVDPDDRILYFDWKRDRQSGGVSYADFEDWQAQATSFDGMAVVANGGLRLRVSDQRGSPETYDATQLSANAFQVLGQRPILGRDFAASDGVSGAAPVAILSYGLWERRYGKDPGTIGQTVRLNESFATLIGVMAQGFDFPHHRVDLWVPLIPSPSLRQRQTRSLWFVFGHMAEGVTIKSAGVEMDTIGRQLEMVYPLTNQGFHPVVLSFHEFFIGQNATTIYGAMWAAVGFVLLIACANLANLLLARALGRSREIGIRIALGAGRWRIIRQLLIEGVMLSAVGGVFGWLMTIWSVRAYELMASPPSSYDHWTYAMDYRVFAYLVAISVGTGLLFGLVPAKRLSTLEISATLKEGGRGAMRGRRGTHVSAVLVIGEMALAVVLLTGAGVMIRTFLNIYTADLGVQTATILTASVGLAPTRYPRAEGQMAFFERLATRVTAIPGVESVTLANSLPGLYAPRLPYELAGTPPVDESRRPSVLAVIISPGYFGTLGARVLAGRAFSDVDEPSGVPVAIVNQRFASTLWPGEDPLGKRLRLFDGKTPDAWRMVVGVASNIVQSDATGQTVAPLVYAPFRQKPAQSMTVIARTLVPPGSLATAVRREIQAMDADLVIGSGYGSVEGPKTLAESLAFNYWSNGINGVLFLTFAAIALLLASVGLYAVVAHSVSQRTQEIGIRTAMGATTRDILALVMKQGMLPVGIGLIVGLAAALAVTPILKSQLVNVSPADPISLLGASGILVLSATVGCGIPARRATKVDPLAALRCE
jgi:predicted permease